MIRVIVELIPGGIGTPVEIGRAEIWNDLGDMLNTDGRRGSYGWRIWGKRTYGKPLRSSTATTTVRDFPRLSKNVWCLLARVLDHAGYQ